MLSEPKAYVYTLGLALPGLKSLTNESHLSPYFMRKLALLCLQD